MSCLKIIYHNKILHIKIVFGPTRFCLKCPFYHNHLSFIAIIFISTHFSSSRGKTIMPAHHPASIMNIGRIMSPAKIFDFMTIHILTLNREHWSDYVSCKNIHSISSIIGRIMSPAKKISWKCLITSHWTLTFVYSCHLEMLHFITHRMLTSVSFDNHPSCTLGKNAQKQAILILNYLARLAKSTVRAFFHLW